MMSMLQGGNFVSPAFGTRFAVYMFPAFLTANDQGDREHCFPNLEIGFSQRSELDCARFGVERGSRLRR